MEVFFCKPAAYVVWVMLFVHAGPRPEVPYPPPEEDRGEGGPGEGALPEGHYGSPSTVLAFLRMLNATLVQAQCVQQQTMFHSLTTILKIHHIRMNYGDQSGIKNEI
jgi:hypothetical protein